MNIGIGLWSRSLLGILSLLTVTDVNFSVAIAQILPDRTLGNESSIVTPNVLVNGVASDRIDGGAIRGSNLFHSFQEFNIREGRGGYFANPTVITNIFSRVTGSNPSTIMGTLGVLGNANLYFLNPNGIMFGANARLDVRGSFVGSTASSFKFADGSEFSATVPQAPPLLQMSVSPGLQYGTSQPGATIANQGILVAGQDLTLQATNLDLQGQLQAGRDLTLQATDTIQIRDSINQPFIAQAGGKLLVQGDQAIDIFALNHPNSGLMSGSDMTLRSTSSVSGDAHYWTGGNFLIEQLDGNLGNLYSPNDPIIYSNGDVVFSGYRGASLHILAGGQVRIPIGVWIERPDTTGEAIYPNSPTTGEFAIVKLSDGQPVTVQGNTQATVDIRAGVQLPTAPNLSSPNPPNPLFNGIFNFVVPPFFPNPAAPATTADITIGDIRIDPPDGLVLVTNHYRPNLNLPSGNITINPSIREASIPGSGILTNSTTGNGGAVFIDARGSVTVNSPIDTNSIVGNGGNLTILAKDSMTINATIATSPAPANSGSFGNSGTVSLNARNTLTLKAPINTISYTGNGGTVSLVSQQGSILLNPTAKIETFAATVSGLVNTGNSGSIDFNAAGQITINAPIDTASNAGQAGDVTLRAQNAITINQNIRSSTLGAGAAGNISLSAPDVTIQGDVATNRITSITANSFGSGQGGNLRIIDTARLTLQNLAQLSAVTGNDSRNFPSGVLLPLTSGQAGTIDINTTESVNVIQRSFIAAQTNDLSTGAAGKVTITTPQFNLRDGSFISTASLGSGAGSKIEIYAGITTLSGTDVNGLPSAFIVDGFAAGSPGAVQVQGQQLFVQEGALVSGNAGRGVLGRDRQPGQLTVRVSDLIQVSGSGRIAPSSIVFETLGAANAGDLRLATNQLLILDGGNVSAQTIGTGQAGTLAIEAKNIQVSGNSADGRFRSRLFLNSSGSGDAGKLQIQTSTLLVQSGGEVSAATANVGQGGSINLTAANVTIDGTGARGASQLSFRSSGSGNAGGIRLDTDQLTLQNQGQITVEGTGSGNAGNLNIIARAVSLDRQAVLSAQTNSAQGGNISLQNVNTLTLDNNSTISAATVNGQSGTVELQASTLTLNRNSELAAKATGNGTAGSLTIATQTLNLLNGSTATVASVDGAGGNLVVNASQAVTLQGSRLVAEATGNGRAGDLRINADRLTLDRSQAGVDSNQQGGNLAVEARSVFMDNGSRLSATTAAATGGNITLKVQESITLRRDSDIRAEATGTGNGGNVTLEAGRFIFAILSENSDVLAFAPQGQGGNITARADGILTFRQFQRTDTPESDFVASGGSNLLDGSITLDTRNPQPSPPLPNQFANPTLVEGCLATPGNRDRPPRAQNQYFRTGAGGLATSPNEALRSSQIRVPWNRLEDKAATANPTEIREAEGFIRLANGRVRLVSSTRPLAASPCLLGGQP